MDEIFVINSYGDDYHGSFGVEGGFFLSEEAAKKRMERLVAEQEPCGDCGHTYTYVVNCIKAEEVEVDKS